jgi:hypothetical protein
LSFYIIKPPSKQILLHRQRPRGDTYVVDAKYLNWLVYYLENRMTHRA